MGNLHSTWSPNTHRHGGGGREEGGPRAPSYLVGGSGLAVGNSSSGVAGGRTLNEGGAEVTGGASDDIIDGTSSLGVQSSGTSTRYSLRRTLARQARAAEANERGVTNASTSSLDSINSTTSSGGGMASRRRRREQLDPDDNLDGRSDAEARRRRIERGERSAFTPEADDDPGQSLFFYFSLPSDALGARSNSTSTGGSNTSPSVSNNSTSSAPAPRRLSGRLQQAAEFLRERLGVGPARRSHHIEPVPVGGTTSHQPSHFSSLTADAAGSVAGERPMVLVRLRHVQQPSAGQATSTANEGARADVNHGTATSAESNAAAVATNADTSSVFQWTIYFVIPRPEAMNEGGGSTGVDEATPRSAGAESPLNHTASPPPLGPSHFDATVALQSAFAVLRALMSGENMSYEDWIRLQEMMGTVTRGVAKELIEEQLPAKLFTPSLGMISCPICLAEYEGGESFRTLPCAHSFHAACIDTWLVTRNDCPLCRQPPVTVPI